MGVTIQYDTLSGERRRMKLAGFSARVFQHEYDHLDGVLFHDRMAPEVLERVRSALVELELEYCAERGLSPQDASGPAGVESASIGLRRTLAKRRGAGS